MKGAPHGADKHPMQGDTQPRDLSYRRAAPEAALLGGVVGIAHAVAESVVHALWDVPVRPLDRLISLALYGLIGVAAGVCVWIVGLVIKRATGRVDAWETGIGRRRLFWCAIVVGHTAIGWLILFGRGEGSTLVPTLAVNATIAGILLGLGYRRAGSFGNMVIASLALGFLNIGATTLPQVAPDLPGFGRISAAALGMLSIPLVLMVVIACRATPAAIGTGERRPQAALAGLAALAALSVGLSHAVFPFDLGWHVRQAPLGHPPDREGVPNILLVVLDTVRADHLNDFGYPRETMPALSRFARQECDVARTILATAPSTLPSHASMFTGLYAHVHGAHGQFLVHEGPRPEYGYPLRDDLPTLAEQLSGLGFQTAGIVANHAVLGSYGLSRGFDYYDVAPSGTFRGEQISWLHASRITGIPFGETVRSQLPERVGRSTLLYNRWSPPYRRAEEITDRSLAWLRQHGDRPFFLFLNYLDAHDPYMPVAEVKDRFAPADVSVDWAGFIPHDDFLRVMSRVAAIPDQWREYLVSQYDAELLYLDSQVQRLFDGIQGLGCFDDTLIVIVGDHGEGFLEHGLLRHVTSTYDTQVRVPLYIKFPESMRNDPPSVPAWFQFVDLYPSVMDMLGEPPPPGLAGSVWAAGRDYALTEVFVHEPDVQWLRRELCAVVLGPYKYISSTTGQAELYDLSRDPGETENIVGAQPDVEARAQAIIAERNAALVKQLQVSDEDADLQRKLRSLGYIK